MSGPDPARRVPGPRPGLAVERTVLAWTRTWLSVAVCGLLLIRIGLGSSPLLVAGLAVSAVATLVVTVVGRRRAAILRPLAGAPTAPVPRATRSAATLAATISLLALAVALLLALH
ncbi:MAG TPA: DUF202 domain-containing protein [Mycobacteriales bacterium]|nr:DUF202 domain-containing protein [Mycobacteriales bacterium]